MKASIKMIRKRRKYTEDFKKKIVEDFEKGQFSVLQLGKEYDISFQLIYKWIYKYSKYNEKGCRVVEKKDSLSEKLKQAEKQIKELQSVVGKKQIRIEYLERMILIAEKELKIDFEKNLDTPQ